MFQVLIVQLEQELQQLLTAKQISMPGGVTNIATTSSSFISPCAAYANLKKGDTNATTGGKVSQLQAFLGISPATGYYGAQTSIGYQNKCGALGNAQPTSVAGMSEYTDSNFGFSFWYPSSWQVQQETVQSPNAYPGAFVPKQFAVTGQNSRDGVTIQEITAPQTIQVGNPYYGYDTYYFNPSLGEWTDSITDAANGSPDRTVAADISNNTMGGLHMFSGGARFGVSTLIPLSAKNFLMVTSNDTSNVTQNYVADTIVATNPNVATPVSTAQQTSIIQAEANAYGVNTSVSSNGSMSFTASPTSGSAPLSVTFSASGVPSGASVNFGDGTIEQTDSLFGNGTTNSAGYCGAGPDFFCYMPHIYASPGTYIATLRNYSGAVVGTQTVTVGGASTGSLQTYTNSQYGFSLQYPSNVQLNTTPASLQSPAANINAGTRLAVFGPVQKSFTVTEPGWGTNGVVTIDGSVYAGVSSNTTDVANCMIAPSGPEIAAIDVTNETMNGIHFLSYTMAQPATGMEEDDGFYTTVHDDVCYSIFSSIDGIESGHLNTADAAANDSVTAQLQSELDSISQSFRFTQ
jgi:hypothetical protein